MHLSEIRFTSIASETVAEKCDRIARDYSVIFCGTDRAPAYSFPLSRVRDAIRLSRDLREQAGVRTRSDLSAVVRGSGEVVVFALPEQAAREHAISFDRKAAARLEAVLSAFAS